MKNITPRNNKEIALLKTLSRPLLKKIFFATFDSYTIEKGRRYYEEGHVIHTHFSDGQITASVKGSQHTPYRVTLYLRTEGTYTLSSACSCPVAFDCKHCAATIFEILHDLSFLEDTQKIEGELIPDEKLDHRISYWLNTILNSTPQHHRKNKSEEVLVYIFNIDFLYRPRFMITTKICRKLKNGELGKPQDFYPNTETKQKRISDEDLETFSFLELLTNNKNGRSEFNLEEKNISHLLEKIIPTRRCYWKTISEQPLHFGKTKEATFSWELENNLQTLRCNLQTDSHLLLPTTPLWYVDAITSEVGKVVSTIPEFLVSSFLSAPTLSPIAAKKIHTALQQRFKEIDSFPLPKVFQKVEEKEFQPTPCLHFFCAELPELKNKNYYNIEEKKFALANFRFRYGPYFVEYKEKESLISRMKEETLLVIKRNFEKEKQYQIFFQENNIKPVSNYFLPIDLKGKQSELLSSFLIAEADNHVVLINFGSFVLADLLKKGWEITFSPDYPVNEIIEPDEWYSELNETSEYDWFNLELGIIVKNQKISLLNPLLKIINGNNFNDLIKAAHNNKNAKCSLQISEGKFLLITPDRLLPILQVLHELYSLKETDENTVFRLSRARAALLIEMEKAFSASKLRWLGATALLELGHRLQNFSGIQEAMIPKLFQATLRPYQAMGVNWLQFLREYELNGILADDMGLGKTVQTLAHLLIEKESGRLTNPALIIAPTSVISNWRIESKRFSPQLQVLFLQGLERKLYFTEIQNYDLVLTSYSLLVRDKEILTKQKFHFIILDEAQYIKNKQAKITQIVQQLTSKHRLCLTGTPLENHLGELWSLFNFLMPGLLGGDKEFKTRFRIPIEKRNDTHRQQLLRKIIKPFMLRRTKSEVAHDLPEKIEIIHPIELQGAQRDLYESIRLAMHQKVKKAIDNQGIERSQIIILDALLKLRQICCDPRLLKLETAKKTNESAKLTALMEMLPEMIEEGRRILLFSQFTSMLSLIEEKLPPLSIPYLKLTGSTQDRLSLVTRFQNKEIPLFLISLKAGGTGLNLTAADTVIHYDPWWNPAVESQATDRAHRIGQDKTVFVYKLVTTGTVEEKILTMQEKKKALIAGVFEGKQKQNGITKEDFDALFS